MMLDSWVTRRTRVGEAIEIIPDAEAIFVKHGIEPSDCGARMHELTLSEAVDECELRDLDGLIRELNAILAQTI